MIAARSGVTSLAVPSPSSPASPLRAASLIILACAAVLLVSGCGRKGPLEPPPGAVGATDNPLEERETADPAAPKPLIPTVSPVGNRKGQKIKAPKEPFVLDPIL